MIRLCVVGQEKSDLRFKQGHPDLSPSVLVLDTDSAYAKRAGKMGILMSLQATGAQLCSYLGQLTQNPPAQLEVKLCRPGDPKAIWIKHDDRTLQDRGATPWSVVQVSDSSGPIPAFNPAQDHINLLPRTHRNPGVPSYQPGTGELTDEEMVQLAIQASLEDLAGAPRMVEEVKSVQAAYSNPALLSMASTGMNTDANTNMSFNAPPDNVPMLDWDMVDDRPDIGRSGDGQVEKPKTPSTGYYSLLAIR